VPIPLAVNDVLQVVIWNQLLEQACLNVLYFQVRTVTGTPFLEEVCDDLDDAIATFVTPLMSSTGSHLGITARRIRPTPSATVLNQHGFAPGAVASEPLGNQVAALVTKRTATPGPGGRGRIFFGLLPKTFSTDGINLTVAGKTAVQTAADLLLGPLAIGPMGNSCTIGEVIYQARPTPVVKDVTANQARNKLATQRRRGGTGKSNTPPF
jgi:hypothetical protein